MAASAEGGYAEDALVNAQGLSLFTRRWSPVAPPPRAKVLLVHGFTWHSGYFLSLAAQLVKLNLAVASYDAQAHGRSESLQGARGFIRSPQDLVNDVHQVLQWFATIDDDHSTPLFVYGESFGATTVASMFMDDFSPPGGLDDRLLSRVRGVVLSGTAVRMAPGDEPPKALFWALQALASLVPRATLPVDTVAEKFSDAFGDKDFAERVKREDPLINIARPRLGTMVGILDHLHRFAAALEALRLPVLVLNGRADTRTRAEYAQELYERASSADKHIVLYDDGRHQLLNDKPHITAKFVDDILQWIEARL